MPSAIAPAVAATTIRAVTVTSVPTRPTTSATTARWVRGVARRRCLPTVSAGHERGGRTSAPSAGDAAAAGMATTGFVSRDG
jgi:hypothetical protein